MKQLLVVLSFIVFLVSCSNQSTEEKLLLAVEKLERDSFALINEKIEKLKIHELSYQTVSEKDRLRQQGYQALENRTDNASINGPKHYNGDNLDSVISEAERALKNKVDMTTELETLILEADTTKKFYQVHYSMDFESDKQSSTASRRIFLDINTLKPNQSKAKGSLGNEY